MKKLFKGGVVLLLMFFVQITFAQDKVISGVVSDETGPLPGVSILKKGTTKGTETDFDGKYTIKAKVGDILVFSFLGMNTVEKKVGKLSVYNVKLESEFEAIDEVVITGITKTDKRLFTGAVTKLKATDVKIEGVPDISRSLEGRAAGVSVQNVSGTFGAAPKIRVRGATSIYGNSKPLWVVDGVILEDVVNVTADDLASGDPTTLISSAIAGLNPDDIESFDVLKDGSATSIYGAKAMSGVVVITTKKGRNGVSTFNYTSNFTHRVVPRYSNFNIMNSQEQMEVYQDMQRAGYLGISDMKGKSSVGVYGKMYEDLYELDPKTGDFKLGADEASILSYLRKAERRNTNWFKELFNYNMMQNHSISMSSGGEKSTYYASLSALVDPGWTKQSSVRRYTANLNASYKLSDKLKLNVISSGSYRKQKAPGSEVSKPNDVMGAVGRDFDINPYKYALSTSRALSAKEFYKRDYAPFNILKELDNNYMDINVSALKFQGEFTWNVAKGLTAKFLGSINYTSSKREHHITEFSNKAMSYRTASPEVVRKNNSNLYQDPDEKFGVKKVVLPEGGFYTSYFNELMANSFRASLQYSKNIDNTHIIDAFVGTQANSSNRHFTWNRGVGMQYSMGETPFFDYKYFKKMKEDGNEYYGTTNLFDRELAFFGNLTYSYKHKYTLNGTLRYEGSNQLGKSKQSRWLPTWNISGSWNAHEEDFFSSLQPALSRLTLKGSYSLTATRGSVSNSSIVIKNQTIWRHKADAQEGSLYIDGLENSELTYEKKNELNIGVDLGFLNNRINLSVDWYKRNNYDLIGPVNTQGIGGQVLKFGNVAGMKSSGLDLALSTQNIKTDDFSWTTSFIYSKSKNEVTRLENNTTMFTLVSGTGFTRVGYPVRSLFSIPFKGLDEQGLPTFTNREGKTTSTDINFQERDLLDNLEYSGSMDPTDVGSFGNTFKYKGLTLNIFATYSFGNVVRLDPFFRNQYSDLDAMPREFRNRWVVAGDEKVTNIPVIATKRHNQNDTRLEKAYNAYNYSTERVAKGDFIRMKEISIGYSFDKDVTKSLGLNSLSLKLQGTNLFLLYSDKKLNGQDPEFFNAGGVAMPVPKQFTFTIKAGL
ncbi:MAG: SusC/RagA family TonB-linked outer membrane protein [Tenacibaculum sp.]|nr:SusC/RagA family TonB-linked outer membrane protein [Tenacibaculum sp.]